MHRFPQLDGLLLGEECPEDYAKEPEQIRKIMEKIAQLCRKGLPCLAEGGGFLDLRQMPESMTGGVHAVAVQGRGFPHLYSCSNPGAIDSFLQACMRQQAGRRAQAHWDGIAKPIDGLGLLETYVVKLCAIAADPVPPQ